VTGEKAEVSTRVADEYGDLRGEFKQCLFTYRDADGGLVPTVTWEGIRAGATDWRHLATLEEAVASATGAERECGLREVVAEVLWRTEQRPGWGNDRAAALRTKMAEEIVRLQGAG